MQYAPSRPVVIMRHHLVRGWWQLEVARTTMLVLLFSVCLSAATVYDNRESRLSLKPKN